MKKGLIHIYCGDGKGKTTAATGLAVRAAGSGMKVLFSRFLKNEDSGELKILDAVEGITVLHIIWIFQHAVRSGESGGSGDLCTAVGYGL